jgi:hypothetical protein
MSRVRYVGSSGQEPPLNELEKEKLKGQQLNNEISQTKLRRLHEEVLDRREASFVFDTVMIIIRQELMRAPSLAVREPELLRSLSPEQLHAVRMSVDRTVRSALNQAADLAEKFTKSPKKVIAELAGAEEPSQKEVDAARRKKARKNARRRVIRRAKA